MSDRFTALIGWLDRPTVDGRVWCGSVRLRDRSILLRSMPEVMLCSPPAPEAAGLSQPFLGRINRLHLGDSGAIYASGRALPDVADALNEGRSTLRAELHGGVSTHRNDRGELVFTDVLIVGAVVGDSLGFPWRGQEG